MDSTLRKNVVAIKNEMFSMSRIICTFVNEDCANSFSGLTGASVKGGAIL